MLKYKNMKCVRIGPQTRLWTSVKSLNRRCSGSEDGSRNKWCYPPCVYECVCVCVGELLISFFKRVCQYLRGTRGPEAQTNVGSILYNYYQYGECVCVCGWVGWTVDFFQAHSWSPFCLILQKYWAPTVSSQGPSVDPHCRGRRSGSLLFFTYFLHLCICNLDTSSEGR